RMTSSWSWPHELWPLRSSMPITVKGTFLIRMIWPTDSASPKRLSAVLRDRQLAPGAETDAARGGAARQRDDEIRPEALDLLRDARLRAGAHANHRDDGGNTDDDAEHREGAPQLVDAQRADGNADAL